MTSKRIRELDHETIQQIAAGEVINDPAAIVKETVENSLDAESSEISLEIRGGGKDYIRISDNGFGISREDIPLAFKRHSTSKLFTAEDLYNISSFGFRGEALASIIAVSKLELFTKTRDGKGSQAIIENGEIKEIKDSVCPNGTSLIIRDIFYNFPVRKNFLKNASAEGNKVTDTITRLALGNPNVSFKYIKDGKVIFKSPGSGDLLQAIHSILGRDFSQNLLEVKYKSEKLSIKGYVSSKSFYRSNRNHQYLYVNNRYVFNKEIRSKIEAIYRSLIPNGRFPVYVLFIDIDPAMVDVNIHPTKEEVNFTDIKLINNRILTAVDPVVKESLEVEDLGQIIRQEEKKEEKKTNEPLKLYKKDIEEQSFISVDELYELSLDELEETIAEEVEKAGDVNNDKPIEELFDSRRAEEDLGEDQTKLKPNNNDNDKERQIEDINFSGPGKDEEDTKEDKKIKEKSNSEKNSFKKFINNINIIGSVFETYLIGEDKLNEDLILIDQHAAHERIMYERIIKDFEKEDIHSQVLMTPELVQLTNNELSIFKDNEDFFKNIGFHVEGFGDNTVIIRKVPIIFGKPEIKKLFFEILDNLDYSGSDIDSFYELRLDKISKLACTYAVKSGDKLHDIETDRLLKDLGETEIPFTCPHGRPTVLKLNKKDVEKLFKRIL